jgi:hypothetical protein
MDGLTRSFKTWGSKDWMHPELEIRMFSLEGVWKTRSKERCRAVLSEGRYRLTDIRGLKAFWSSSN